MHADGVRAPDGPDVLVVGVSWRSASLADRGRLAVPADRTAEIVGRMLACDTVLGAVVLSTCNRTEVYVHATDRDRAARAIRDTLARWGGMTPHAFEAIGFEHHGERAVVHLLEVVSGLDSAVPRDRQITGQVRRAVTAAREVGGVDRLLGALFQHAHASSKRLRATTTSDDDVPDLLDLGLRRARRTLGELAACDVLVVGAGEMGGLAVERLGRLAPRSVTIANRGAARRERLAARSGGTPIDLAQLPDALRTADLVVLSTGAPDPILGPEVVTAARAGRTERPLVLLDLAVPRDVDRRCADVPGVTVLDLDELRRDARHAYPWPPALEAAVRRDAAAFTADTRSIAVEPTIVALRAHAEGLRRTVLERAEARLTHLDEDERAAVEVVTRQLVAALLHAPTVGLKAAAARGDGALHAAVLDEAFDLSPAGPPAEDIGSPVGPYPPPSCTSSPWTASARPSRVGPS
jgi:glutamyl-tRNA reductase